jgi:hypothetical protein
MVTEAMEQEHRHDQEEDEEATEDSLGSTVILGKGKALVPFYPSFKILFFFMHLPNYLQFLFISW